MNVPYNVEFIANRRGDSRIARLTKFFSYGLGNISICKLIASGQWQPATQCSYAIKYNSNFEQKIPHTPFRWVAVAYDARRNQRFLCVSKTIIYFLTFPQNYAIIKRSIIKKLFTQRKRRKKDGKSEKFQAVCSGRENYS